MDTPEQAMIPAGGRIDGAFAERAGTVHRALAPIGARRTPSLQLVVDALRQAGVERITAVADEAVWDRIQGVDRWIPAGPEGAQNILNGMAALAPDRPGLVCTSDVPLITPADVADFAAQAPAAAGITVGVVLKERLDAAHPGAPASTFVTLQETGPVATGCLFAVRTGAVLARPHLVRRAFAARKSQWQSVRLLGLRLSWDFVRRRLALAQIVARAEGLLGCKVEVVADVAPNLCYDIDNVDDYLYASAYSERTSHRAGE